MDVVVVIPARMGSTRLPGKPLADIGGKPMVARVADIAHEAGIGEVFIAAGDDEIVDALPAYNVIKTPQNLPSGSDRVAWALDRSHIDADVIVNLQGDMPLLDSSALQKCVDSLRTTQADISTLVTKTPALDIGADPSCVKTAVTWEHHGYGRALYFSRSWIPHGAEMLWYHVGIYAYTSQALKSFVQSPPHPLEELEKLEQLRALGMGMHIAVATYDQIPLGVDTPADLEHARLLLEEKNDQR